MEVFEAKCYRKLLASLIENRPNRGRGAKLQLARAIGCQSTHISQVLAGRAQMTPEQAEAATRFFDLSKPQREYFMLLVMHDRAGSVSLRRYYLEKLRTVEDEQKQLESSLDLPRPKELEQSAYYQLWLYSAVHMAGLVPELCSASAVAQRFQISIGRAAEIINFLVDQKLAVGSPENFSTVQQQLYLPKGSFQLYNYHLTWRAHAMSKLGQSSDDDFRFTAVTALSQSAFEKVVQTMMDTAKSCSETALRDQVPTDLYAFTLDLYCL